MKQIKMLSGIPASGKSTYAKELIRKDRSYGRINRDDLRQMVFGGKWSHYNEKVIIEIERAIAEVLLKHDRNAVIDDTNLSERHFNMWGNLAIDKGARFEEIKFSTPVEECIQRDKARKGAGLASVGRNVIVKMAARYGLLEWPDQDIVLVDIDGTLANGSHREHYVKQEPKDWENYLSRCGEDLPIIPIFKWVSELSKDHTIVIVSGRGAEREEMTLDWFEKVWRPNPLFPELEVPKFPVFAWFFRNVGDRRDDTVVKKEVLELLPSQPVLIIDDRPKVCRMWEEVGLTVHWARGKDIEDF